MMEYLSYEYDSCIHGHHIYKDTWSSYVSEELACAVEENNIHDPYAVAVKKGEQIVGHLPHIISAASSLFLRWNGVILATVTDVQ